MIDHISFAVKSFEGSQDFYDQTLAILNYERLISFDDGDHQVAGYGRQGRPFFWIGFKKDTADTDEQVGKAAGFHVSFVAPDIESIHKWYVKCLELGGTDNGAPGPRSQYHPGYYGAFIVDPSGWRIEACIQNYQG